MSTYLSTHYSYVENVHTNTNYQSLLLITIISETLSNLSIKYVAWTYVSAHHDNLHAYKYKFTWKHLTY